MTKAYSFNNFNEKKDIPGRLAKQYLTDAPVIDFRQPWTLLDPCRKTDLFSQYA